MEDYLPRPSGRYLKTILGSVNMSILDKEAKYQYKEQYEQFKLIVMLIGKAKSNSNHSLDLTNINVSTFRLVQCLFVFLNGQNIKIGSIRIHWNPSIVDFFVKAKSSTIEGLLCSEQGKMVCKTTGFPSMSVQS